MLQQLTIFRLTSAFFINLEHLSHPTLVLLFILWIGKCWTLWTLCQNNTLMLTFTHNHAPGILLWQCPCHRNEKQNSESFFNYDANLTSVITMELKSIFFFFAMWVSLYDVIGCDIINFKNFRENLRYFTHISSEISFMGNFESSCSSRLPFHAERYKKFLQKASG